MARPRKTAAAKLDAEEGRGKKLFYLHPRYVKAFNILAAEQGIPRPGPKLIEEAINLLLAHYGKKLV